MIDKSPTITIQGAKCCCGGTHQTLRKTRRDPSWGSVLGEHFQEKDMLTAEQQLPSRGLGTAELWHWEAQGAARSSRTGDRILPQAVAADR